MRVLAITPKVDPGDDLLGFIHTWMSHLAQRVEHLYVLQLWSAPSALPNNTSVYTMGKNGSVTKPVQLARFSRVVGALCLQRRVDAVLAHMGPIFAVCAAPFARAAGLPLALWYAHGAVSPMLRLAHVLVDRVGTSSPAGFRLPSGKVRYTGQGIDTIRFSPPSVEPANGPILSVGRLSPVKDYQTLLGAVALLSQRGFHPKLEIVGGTHRPAEDRYKESIRALAIELGLAETVVLRPGVPHELVAAVYQRGAMFASASRTGSLDKSILEAMSCARLALTCNEAFADFFGSDRDCYTFAAGDAVGLADRLGEILRTDATERRVRGMELRERVAVEHGVEHLADELVKLLRPDPSPPVKTRRSSSVA